MTIPDDYIHEKGMYKKAFAIECQTGMPVCDMFFLTLARRHNAYLLTLDKKLKDTSVKHSIRML